MERYCITRRGGVVLQERVVDRKPTWLRAVAGDQRQDERLQGIMEALPGFAHRLIPEGIIGSIGWGKQRGMPSLWGEGLCQRRMWFGEAEIQMARVAMFISSKG